MRKYRFTVWAGKHLCHISVPARNRYQLVRLIDSVPLGSIPAQKLPYRLPRSPINQSTTNNRGLP